MQQYFALVNREADSLVHGNVQLSEDRIPSCLLVFRDDKCIEDEGRINRPRTGYVHDAIFFCEAEKPLSQLVRQRRRWINGTFASYLWVLQEKWIWRGHHYFFTKLIAWLIVVINLLQGVFVRLFGPAIITVVLYMWCLSLPLLTSNSVEGTLQVLFEKEALLATGPGARLMAGLLAGLYLVLYALFMIRHTPRAVPANNGKWRSDHRSAYRPRLFALAFIVNAAATILLLTTSIFIIIQVGWTQTPIAFRVVILFSLAPYMMTLLDGIVNSRRPRLTSFLALLRATPCYLLSSVWFAVWFPAYASARVSDLTWGNRDNGTADVDSEVAKYRARIGKVVTATLVISNFTTAAILLWLAHFMTAAVRMVLFVCTGVMSVYYAVAVIDMLKRLALKFISAIPKALGVSSGKSARRESDRTAITKDSSGSLFSLSRNVSNAVLPLEDDKLPSS